jgi:hypothetical protein
LSLNLKKQKASEEGQGLRRAVEPMMVMMMMVMMMMVVVMMMMMATIKYGGP